MYCSYGVLRQTPELIINQFYLFYLTVGQKNVLRKISCQGCRVISTHFLIRKELFGERVFEHLGCAVKYLEGNTGHAVQQLNDAVNRFDCSKSLIQSY